MRHDGELPHFYFVKTDSLCLITSLFSSSSGADVLGGVASSQRDDRRQVGFLQPRPGLEDLSPSEHPAAHHRTLSSRARTAQVLDQFFFRVHIIRATAEVRQQEKLQISECHFFICDQDRIKLSGPENADK